MQLFSSDSWSTPGADASWLAHFAALGPLLLVGLLLALLVYAALRQQRYRAVGKLGAAREAQLRQAIASLEARTSAEVAVVVLEESAPHPAAPLRSALLFVFVGVLLLNPVLPWEDSFQLVSWSGAWLVLGYAACLLLAPWRALMISDKEAEAAAHQRAHAEFAALALEQTRSRTGVLVFVSLLEHSAIVLGDRAIAAKLGDRDFEAVDQALLDGIRSRHLASGLQAALERLAPLLAQHFPLEAGDANERPDHLLVRRN